MLNNEGNMKKNKSALIIIAVVLYCLPAMPQSSKIMWSGFASGFGNSGNPTSILMNSWGESFSGSAQNSSSRIIAGFLTFRETHLTGVKNEQSIVPKVWKLEQNYPNPFNPSTTIKYQVPKPGYVSLKIYDILGREILTLVNENKTAGYFEARFNAVRFPSGVYIYQLRSKEYSSDKKMILLK
jgi:Secretion system C-terminal sorting domain